MAQAKAPKKRRTSADVKKRSGKPKVEKNARTASSGGTQIDPERLHLVEGMLARCCTQRDIVAAVVKKYGVSHQTGHTYYHRVIGEWSDAELKKRSYHRMVAVNTLDACIAGAMEDRKWSDAVSAVRTKAQIIGLNQPDEVIVTTSESSAMEKMKAMSSGELRAFLKREQVRIEHLKGVVKAEIAAPLNATPAVH